MAGSTRTPLWVAVAVLAAAAAGAWLYQSAAPVPGTSVFSTRVLRAPPAGPGPLKLRGDRAANYFVKVRDVATGKDVLAAMIAGGGMIDLRLPTGSYDLRYAAGAAWEGEKTLFGPDTVYFRHDQTLTLTFDGAAFMGYVIDLVPVPRPGASLAPIPARDF